MRFVFFSLCFISLFSCGPKEELSSGPTYVEIHLKLPSGLAKGSSLYETFKKDVSHVLLEAKAEGFSTVQWQLHFEQTTLLPLPDRWLNESKLTLELSARVFKLENSSRVVLMGQKKILLTPELKSQKILISLKLQSVL